MHDLLPIQANGLTLRRLRPQDLAAFTAYRADKTVAEYQSWPAMTDRQALTFLNDMEATAAFPVGWWQIGIADGQGMLIGDIGLCLSEDRGEVEMGITLAAPSQGQGHAKSAIQAATALVFQHTQAQRVLLITDARNTRALRLFAALGLQQIDTLTDAGFPEPVFEIRRP